MKDTPSKLDQIRALGSTEIFRRFGAPTERKPVPEVPGVTKGVTLIPPIKSNAGIKSNTTSFVNEPPHPPPLDTGRPVGAPERPKGKRGRPKKGDGARRDMAAYMRARRARKNAGSD